jgi:hypothetical protein
LVLYFLTYIYPKCREGYYGVGPVCWQSCREGYTDIGTSCKKNNCFSKRGILDFFNQIGDGVKDVGKKIEHGVKDVGKKIGDGIKDIVTCFYTKHTYGRTVGKLLECKEGHDNNVGLCYPKCREHYSGVGPVCWGQCSGSTPHRCALGWFVISNDSAASKDACKTHLKAQFAAVGVLAINVAVIAASAALIVGTFGTAAPAVIAADSVWIYLTPRDY